MSKATDKCQLFFKALKKTDGFMWMEECEKAFCEMKAYFSSPLFLTKPNDSETLYVYLAVSDRAVSTVLIREENKVQWLVY